MKGPFTKWLQTSTLSPSSCAQAVSTLATIGSRELDNVAVSTWYLTHVLHMSCVLFGLYA